MSQSNANFNILSNNVGLTDSSAIDAFNRLRISESAPLFAIQSQYNINSPKMESGATGTGVSPTHSNSEGKRSHDRDN